jgi:hypoxanthine phosphoribosyltransferase
MVKHSDIEEILISQEQIQEKCQELGESLTRDYTDKNPVLIGLLKGCVPFMAELIKHIDTNLEIDFMDVSSYFGGTESTGSITVEKDFKTDVSGRHVIVVDDIIDTGITLFEVCKLIRKRGALSVEIVTLVDKPEGRKIGEINPKYRGFYIPKKFVVGFGLDYDQRYRNLPYIGVLKECVYKK